MIMRHSWCYRKPTGPGVGPLLSMVECRSSFSISTGCVCVVPWGGEIVPGENDFKMTTFNKALSSPDPISCLLYSWPSKS